MPTIVRSAKLKCYDIFHKYTVSVKILVSDKTTRDGHVTEKPQFSMSRKFQKGNPFSASAFFSKKPRYMIH